MAQWNEETKRYTFKNIEDEEDDEEITEDDIILQAMMMLLLARMEQWWGQEKTVRQLSIWNHDKKPNESDCLNLWESEIQDLIATKKLGKNSTNHQDNYCTFVQLYPVTSEARWNRRSDTFLGQLHMLAEQATVQWALAAERDDLEMLACCVLREMIQTCLLYTSDAADE